MKPSSWCYWAEVANAAFCDAKAQTDWLAWQRFRAKLISPFDEWTGDFER